MVAADGERAHACPPRDQPCEQSSRAIGVEPPEQAPAEPRKRAETVPGVLPHHAQHAPRDVRAVVGPERDAPPPPQEHFAVGELEVAPDPQVFPKQPHLALDLVEAHRLGGVGAGAEVTAGTPEIAARHEPDRGAASFFLAADGLVVDPQFRRETIPRLGDGPPGIGLNRPEKGTPERCDPRTAGGGVVHARHYNTEPLRPRGPIASRRGPTPQ